MRSFRYVPALLFFTLVGLVHAQPAIGLRERVRALNGSLLRLHGNTQGASPMTSAGFRAQARTTILERAAALETLIQQDPEEALKLGFSTELLAELRRSFPQAANNLESYGEWEGPAEYWVLDDASMKSSTSAIKMTAGGETLDVHYAGDAPSGLTCGSVLKVSAMKVNRHLAPVSSSVRTIEATTKTAQAGGPCSTTGTQNIAVILVTFPGVAPPISASAVQDVFFGAGNRSVSGYWQDASYGKATVTGNVFGWYTLSKAYSCDQYSSLGAEALKLADPDVNFPSYNRIFYIFPLPSGCTYGGLSTVGCLPQASADGTFTASNHYVIANYLSPNDQGVELAVHEGGHGLTLDHARSRGFAPLALGAPGVNGTITEYGDNFDSMGYYNLGHYSAQHKVQLGWLAPSNVLNVQGSGVYSVAPMGTSTAAPLALQVQRGTGSNNYLWIEYHQPSGNYESQLASSIYSGATIRYQDSLTGTGYSNLLNFSPQNNSWFTPILPVGQGWTDPYTNVSLTVNTATANALTVGVNYGVIPCTPGTPVTTVSPLNPGVVSGSAVTYTLTVTNKDSSGCGTSAFAISAADPYGWLTSMSSSSVNLSPGQSASIAVSKTVPVGTTPGTYAVPFSVAGPSLSASTSANCSVTAPPGPLSVTVSVPSAINGKSAVGITANVLAGSAPASGASVTFTVAGPKGNPSSQTATANSSGVATWNFKPNVSGLYSVSSKATLGSQTTTSNTVTFTIQ